MEYFSSCAGNPFADILAFAKLTKCRLISELASNKCQIMKLIFARCNYARGGRRDEQYGNINKKVIMLDVSG